jgi:hypothetical protein
MFINIHTHSIQSRYEFFGAFGLKSVNLDEFR